MAETAHLLRAVPILPSANLERTSAFCTEKLGFRLSFRYPDYAGFEREGIALHYYVCEELTVIQHATCYLYVRGIDALYAEYRAAGVIHPNGALEAKPWGVREFVVLDPDGVGLRFGQLLET